MTTSICRDTGPFVSSKIKRVGPFLLGPSLGNPLPVPCLKQYLARRERTQEYHTIKVLTLPERDSTEQEPLQEQQGKVLIHTEQTILSRLIGWEGVIQQHGFFKEVNDEPVEIEGKIRTRKVTQLCLVLDASATPHDYHQSGATGTNRLTNLQYYVLKNQKIPEPEAISIFINIVQIVERLHRENIVHRDLKLGNFTYNVDTREVVLCNFGLAKELESERQALRDQRGSPAYISPEVISGKPYFGKPSDMWALGVTFFTMLFGQFPFYEKDPRELFRKIKRGEYAIPGDAVIGSTSVNLIQSLLVLDPTKRLTASELLYKLKNYVKLRYAAKRAFSTPEVLQVVPIGHGEEEGSHEGGSCQGLSGDSDWSKEGDYEPKVKRSRTEDQNMFDLEEVLMANASPLEKEEENAESVGTKIAEGGVQELPQKRLRYAFDTSSGLRSIKISKVKEEPRVLTLGDLEKLYAIYVANKTKGRGGATAAAATPTALPPTTRTQSEAEAGRDDDASGRSQDEARLREVEPQNAAVESQTLLQNVSDSASAAAPRPNVLLAKRLRNRQYQQQQERQRESPSVPVN